MRVFTSRTSDITRRSAAGADRTPNTLEAMKSQHGGVFAAQHVKNKTDNNTKERGIVDARSYSTTGAPKIRQYLDRARDKDDDRIVSWDPLAYSTCGSKMSDIKPPTTFNILALPSELRNRIYELALVAEEPIEFNTGKCTEPAGEYCYYKKS
ncbi:uncharacterized protein LTR77_005090 [Saxophila tyrrhenica]|uniref:Uncharacterized protein n=1 Tax=Saxophila tyrrhenica TaxID=1690608 RepID=A0AAV9PB14_9PEZI|nr:hypothetical protein LTR77_005090 [Saxophila tyrrhenica]